MKKIYKPKKDRAYSVCETVQAILAVIIGSILICMIAIAIKMPTKAKAQEETTTTATYYEEPQEDKSQYEKYIDIVPLEPAVIKHIVEKATEKNESCIGLMQVNCENYDNPNQAMASLISPTLNVDAGIEILDSFLKKYPVEKALTCYNCGEHGAKGKSTSGYAKKILKNREKYEFEK